MIPNATPEDWKRDRTFDYWRSVFHDGTFAMVESMRAALRRENALRELLRRLAESVAGFMSDEPSQRFVSPTILSEWNECLKQTQALGEGSKP